MFAIDTMLEFNIMDRFIITELGKEKLCTICKEYYPYDSEFFYKTGIINKNGTVALSACCKACYEVHYRFKKKKSSK